MMTRKNLLVVSILSGGREEQEADQIIVEAAAREAKPSYVTSPSQTLIQ